MEFTKCTKGLKGSVTVPGDKSITHRGIMLGSIARGTTYVYGYLNSLDCRSSISCFQKLGIDIEINNDFIKVNGKGLRGLSAPADILDTGNSGTTTRIISGILAAQPFTTVLNGDESIQKRPMKRVITPLTQMGARITCLRGNDCAPLEIIGGNLHGIDYISPVASAQVKSAVLLAGLYADGPTSVTEPSLSRNHTELMLRGFGATVSSSGNTARVEPADELYATRVNVPGDISSAAFFIAAALITPGSEVIIKNVGINPTRAGILKVCEAMGARIEYLDRHESAGEPVADLLVKYSELHGTVIEGDIIPT
ncbi:MAG: 3-phosphoshikimate 1-carboxyvinyltransferase, partial [Lachnospiraceae bacterium]|nr:3-phosphoshikimate 1-carboxyvinyltransferase [Lachnospiraceae bacterium]